MITFKQFRDSVQQAVYFLIDPGIRLMIRVGITPNMITTLGMLGNVFAAALFVYSALYLPADDYSLVGWAGVTIILFSIFDMIDGRLARVGNMCTTFGAFYDSVLDRYCELFTLSGIAFYFMQRGDTLSAIITFLALIGSIMVSYVRARAEGLGLDCKVGLMQRPERVVVTSVGAMLCGALSPVVRDLFDPAWILLFPQILIAVLANWTAYKRIQHVQRQMSE